LKRVADEKRGRRADDILDAAMVAIESDDIEIIPDPNEGSIFVCYHFLGSIDNFVLLTGYSS